MNATCEKYIDRQTYCLETGCSGTVVSMIYSALNFCDVIGILFMEKYNELYMFFLFDRDPHTMTTMT